MGLWVFFFLERKGEKGGCEVHRFLKMGREQCVCGAVSDPGEGKMEVRMQEEEGDAGGAA